VRTGSLDITEQLMLSILAKAGLIFLASHIIFVWLALLLAS
jgi:hypothetical protein